MTKESDGLGQTWSAQQHAKEALIDAVVALAAAHYPDLPAERSEALIRQYFLRVSPRDLVGREPSQLYPAAVRHWQLAARRTPGVPVIRVYNPEPATDGWHCPYTVIDIVTDDTPFIVDSITGLAARRGLGIHLLAHPLAKIDRDEEGHIRDFFRVQDPQAHGIQESFLHLEVDRIPTSEHTALEADVRSVLGDVAKAVADWQPMVTRARELAAEMETADPPPGVDPAQWHEAPNLLRFLTDNHFIFIGSCEYDFSLTDQGPVVGSIPETGLGVLASTERRERRLAEMAPEVAELAARPHVIQVTKANAHSTVQRNVPLDYVGIKKFDPDGTVIGEYRFIGLFTAAVYARSVQQIPVVGPKVRTVIDQANFIPGTHDANRLLAVLESYPRDELFQISVEELHDFALAIVDLRDRGRVNLFVRRDDFGRFLSCLVFAPRDRFNTDVRLAIEEILMDAYQGLSCTWSTEITGADNARVHFVITTDPAHRVTPPASAVEERLQRVIQVWEDELAQVAEDELGAEGARSLLGRYVGALPAAYRAAVMAPTALADLRRLDMLDDDDLHVQLHVPLQSSGSEMRLKLYRSGSPLTLSAVIPLLHDLGASVTDERPYRIGVQDEPSRWIYDIGLTLAIGGDNEPGVAGLNAATAHRFEEAFERAWRGAAESDGFARLVATAGLTWDEVVVLRAYARYLRQVGTTFTPQLCGGDAVAEPGHCQEPGAVVRGALRSGHRSER